MKTSIEDMKLRAQETLDELFTDNLIPFALSARVVESIGNEEYIVRFHDSRLRSIDVSWHEGQSFDEVIRRAVLDRVSRLNGPFPDQVRHSHPLELLTNARQAP